MSKALSTIKKVALAGLGAAGLALVAHLVEHGDVPEWMHRLFGWVWASLTLTSVWALWELLIPIFAIGALAVLFLHREATKIAQLQGHVSNLYVELGNRKDRELELVARIESLKTKSDDGSSDDIQLSLLVLIAELENRGMKATRQNLMNSANLTATDFAEFINSLRISDHVAIAPSPGGSRYVLTPSGRKLVIAYLSNESAQ